MVSKGRLSKVQRVTALFEEGREVVLQEDGPDGPVLVWVSKLNPFEQEEARKDGSTGRAMAVMRLDDPSSPEMAVFGQALEGREAPAIVDALVYAKQNEDYVQALDDLKAMEDWQDKLLVLERGDELLDDAGAEVSDEQRSELAELNQQYMRKVDELTKGHQDARREVFEGMDDEGLRAAYREEFRRTTGSQGFLSEYKISELYYALRDCSATTKYENGRWDHGGCGSHLEKLLSGRADVRTLPEGLLVVVRDAMQALAMTPQDAGNSDAPASSSASSERLDAVEESSPSIPEAMSPVPAGTS